MVLDHQNELLEAFEGEDDLGVVIRSHIIIENYLNKLIQQLVVNGPYINKIRLDYEDKVKLAIALGLKTEFESPLTCMGTIRNRFAHQLRSGLNKQDVKNLYKSLHSEHKTMLHDVVGQVNIEEGKNLKHNQMPVKQQFVNCTVMLASALQAALKQANE